MDKIPQHNTKRKLTAKMVQPKEPLWLDEYKNNKDFKRKIATISFLESYAENIIKEAYNNPDCTTVEDLYLEFGIPERTYYSWVNKYDFFKEAHQNALLIIGRRREKNGIQRKWDTLGSMHQYNDRWKKGEEWRSSLRQKENKSKGDITVIMEKFVESKSVPLKKTPEETRQS